MTWFTIYTCINIRIQIFSRLACYAAFVSIEFGFWSIRWNVIFSPTVLLNRCKHLEYMICFKPLEFVSGNTRTSDLHLDFKSALNCQSVSKCGGWLRRLEHSTSLFLESFKGFVMIPLSDNRKSKARYYKQDQRLNLCKIDANWRGSVSHIHWSDPQSNVLIKSLTLCAKTGLI